MRKSTVFISAVLTTFALVLLYNVVSAYRKNTKAVEMATQPAATLAPTATDLPSPTEAVAITPEQAAQLAVQVVGNSNLLSAESSSFDGVDAYKITFTNNDVVYIGIEGQILSVQVAPVVLNVPAAVPHKSNKNAGNASNHSEHESNEEHQEHED
jgi:hypothetical protein